MRAVRSAWTLQLASSGTRDSRQDASSLTLANVVDKSTLMRGSESAWRGGAACGRSMKLQSAANRGAGVLKSSSSNLEEEGNVSMA